MYAIRSYYEIAKQSAEDLCRYTNDLISSYMSILQGNLESVATWLAQGDISERRLVIIVITSYSIHYTKLYEDSCAFLSPPSAAFYERKACLSFSSIYGQVKYRCMGSIRFYDLKCFSATGFIRIGYAAKYILPHKSYE